MRKLIDIMSKLIYNIAKPKKGEKEMKKRIYGLIAVLAACLGLCFGLAGCKDGKAKREEYAGEVQISATAVITVKLTLDETGTFSLTSENDVFGLGGVYAKDGENYIFKRLDGKQIATSVLKEDQMQIDYSDMQITLTKSEKTVQTDKLYGSYKGYVNDGSAFELRMIIRGDNEWILIEEDGDIHEYGKYILEGSMVTVYSNEAPTEIYAFGTIENEILSLDVDGDAIRFQKVNS